MPTQPEGRREHPSTYFMQDRANPEEMERLRLQDTLIATSMGGILPEQPDLASFRQVLDVGCGTSGWLIALAKALPTCTRLTGVDVSQTFVNYARAQAQAAQVSDRVEFYAMDALRMLEFPTNSFDLVNQRFGISWLRTWDWPKLLQEAKRVTRPGGVIRLTEGELLPECESFALTRLAAFVVDALYQAGHLFAAQGDGSTTELASLLERHGIEQVQTRLYPLQYRVGTPAWERFCEDTRLSFQVLAPFLRKWTRVPDDYSDLLHQAIREMHEPGFVASTNVLTAWGKVFSQGRVFDSLMVHLDRKLLRRRIPLLSQLPRNWRGLATGAKTPPTASLESKSARFMSRWTAQHCRSHKNDIHWTYGGDTQGLSF